MEPDVIPLNSSSPPLMDDDGDGELASEEDEFRDFSIGMSCSSLGFADGTDPTSSLRPPSPTIEPATHQPGCSSNHPVEQSQPTSKVMLEAGKAQMDVGGKDCNAEPSLHLTNGFAESEHNSGGHNASVLGGWSPVEETGFADFTVFTEQAGHPWCCGFSPTGNTEQKDGRARGTNSSFSEQICDSGQDVMESECSSHCTHKAKQNILTEIKDCEKRDAALVQQSQVHHQPQEAAGALDFPSEEEELDKPGDSQRERRHSFNSSQTSEVQEDGDTEEIFQTCIMYEPASEDLASFSDDLSFEGASADLEPNVSSLASQDDQTDWDQFDEEDEDLGSCGRLDSFVNSSVGNHNQTQSDRGFHHCNQNATQETSATSNPSPSGTNLQNRFADFTDSRFEHHRDQEDVQTADAGVQILGNLPLSDSFADFCSAPTQADGGASWAEFNDQSAEDGKSWTQFRAPISSLQTDGDAEEKDEQDRAERTRRNSCRASLSCRVQELLQASFPEVVVPAVESEKELLGLSALVQAQHLSESEEDMPDLSSAQRIQQEMLRLHEDIHSAVGLQFQWGGSHTNRTLLSCLGMNTRNIAFIGRNKQPVTVPAFASGLGMLEPTTKDSVPAVCSPGRAAVTAQAPPGPRDIPDPSTHSVQEELPSSQLDWSSRGLSSSQDGTSPCRAPHFWGRR